MKNSIDRTLKLIFDIKESRPITLKPYLYNIGLSMNPYNLVFDEEPHGTLYYNSFFIKVFSYRSTNQALDCLSYHYSNYEDKQQFIDFLENEIIDITELIESGLPIPSDVRKKRLLRAMAEWLKTKRLSLISKIETATRETVETEILNLIAEIRNTRIGINPKVDPRKIILLFLSLQQLVLDDKSVGVLKFKHTVELPHLLKYFIPFANNKIDGIRKQTTILASKPTLSLNIPTYLVSSLRDFFFSESIKIEESDL